MRLTDLVIHLVIKPIDGNHGKGNTTNITTWEQAIKAFDAAKQYGRSVIVEKFITGFDFRLLVINYKFICAALRTPASVYWRWRAYYSMADR